jgi:fructokinase
VNEEADRVGEGQVVVCGEALMDLVFAEDGTLTPHAGGGPFNAARTAARLGTPTSFLARVSNDRFGQHLIERLVADGVDVSTVVRSEHPTMLALAELTATGAASYRFYVAGTATPELSPDDALALLPADVTVLCVGTLGLVLEPMAAASEALVAAVRGRAVVLVDPNIRPRLIEDRPAYLRRLARILSGADVVKLSDEDLAWIDPDRDHDDAATALLEAGPRLVVLTRGARGVTGYLGDQRIDVPGRSVAVADTIGAGDSVAGAILSSLHGHGHALLDDPQLVETMLRLSVAVAAITVSRPGADPPTRAEVDLLG